MPAFHKVLLLYNPVAGHNHADATRHCLLPRRCFAKPASKSTGTDAAKGEGGRQAKAALDRGFDAIFGLRRRRHGFRRAARHGARSRASGAGVLPLGRQTCWPPISRFPATSSRARVTLGYAPRRIAAGQLRWIERRISKQSARSIFRLPRRGGPRRVDLPPQRACSSDTRFRRLLRGRTHSLLP